MISLDSPDWATLKHAYGAATDIPKLLRELYNFPDCNEYTDEPWFTLWSSLCHQGDIYPASFASVPHIVTALEQKPEACNFNYFLLPTEIELRRVETRLQVPPSLSQSYHSAIRKLPSLGLKALNINNDTSMVRPILAAIAVSFENDSYARLLLEIDEESVPDVLEWFLGK